MKRLKQAPAILAALALILTLCACGGSKQDVKTDGGAIAASVREAAEEHGAGEDTGSAAGEYTFFCAWFGPKYAAEILELEEVPDADRYYVEFPDMEGWTVTLDADGTGYLYWGDDNQGPIDRWSLEGETLRFQAGISDFDGTIRDGLMTVEIDEGISICCTASEAAAAGIEPIPLEDYVLLMYEQASGDGAAEADAPTADLPVEGEYTLFAVEEEGYLVEAEAFEIESTLTLEADGTGLMTDDGESMGITSWTMDGQTLSIVMEDGGAADAAVKNGILELDITGDGEIIFFYAQEGADVSGYAPMTMDELMDALAGEAPDSRVRALWESMDTASGVHMSYDLHTDYLDADQHIDVHGRDGVYYSLRTTEVSDYEDTMVTFFRDGTAYNLYPDTMTGLVAATTTSSVIEDDVMLLDDLYSAIWAHAREADYTEETRELDGVTYTAEVFPAGEYTAEAAFYFDGDGRLAYYIEGAPVAETAFDLGESVYTIRAIDGAVDDALFDISGYDIDMT